MIVISGIISVDPADHDGAVALFGPLVEATLAEEGNVTYGFWASPTEPGVFRVYEEWQDDPSLDAHMGSDHMAEFMAGFGALKVTGSTLTRHDVSATTKLM
jgi:quinol monooxygenase YgiN